MNNSITPASLKIIRWSLISVTLISLSTVMVGGAVVLQQQANHPIQFDFLTADAATKVCINGFSYRITTSDSDPQFGGGVQVLEVEKEIKGEIHSSAEGKGRISWSGPKACALKG